MHKHIVVLILFFCVMSCAEKKQESTTITSETAASETQQTPSPPSSLTCWAYSKDDDLIGMTLEMRGQQVSGKLTYTVYDRDRSSGTITGVMRGDTIIADYSHFAQGKPTVQEIVLLFRNNAFIEGIGPTEERDGKIVFKSRSALSFVQDRPLLSVPCHK